MAEQDDVLHLIDDTGAIPEDSSARKWKIAVIDDDQAVHEGTRFALSDYTLNGQGLEILSAYSAAEGRTLMRGHPDIAAVLLDVIMETDVAGLELVEYIRSEIKNETVRIILRTGQPGQAPERRVIVQYDINDYCAGILVLRDDGNAISDDFSVLAGSGCYSRFIGAAGSRSLDPDLRSMVEAAFRRRKHEFVDHRTVLYVRTGSGREVVVLLQAERPLSETD